MKQTNKTEECFRLNPILQQKLDEVYDKWKKKCAFGRLPREEGYHTLLYHALRIVDDTIPTIHRNQAEALEKCKGRK